MAEAKVSCNRSKPEGKSGLTGRKKEKKCCIGPRWILIPDATNATNQAEDRNCRKIVGGRDRDRTCDLMLAKHALSQLSYTPILAIELV
jgi:hypothetical protein